MICVDIILIMTRTIGSDQKPQQLTDFIINCSSVSPAQPSALISDPPALLSALCWPEIVSTVDDEILEF